MCMWLVLFFFLFLARNSVTLTICSKGPCCGRSPVFFFSSRGEERWEAEGGGLQLLPGAAGWHGWKYSSSVRLVLSHQSSPPAMHLTEEEREAMSLFHI